MKENNKKMNKSKYKELYNENKDHLNTLYVETDELQRRREEKRIKIENKFEIKTISQFKKKDENEKCDYEFKIILPAVEFGINPVISKEKSEPIKFLIWDCMEKFKLSLS